EPAGPDRAVQSVGAETRRLQHAADLACTHQPRGCLAGPYDEALREADGEDAAGLACYALDLGNLSGVHGLGLIDIYILSATQRVECDCGAVGRDGRANDEVDRGIVDQPLAIHRAQGREAFAKTVQYARVAG